MQINVQNKDKLYVSQAEGEFYQSILDDPWFLTHQF